MRTIDAMGFQNIHVSELLEQFSYTQGDYARWIRLHRAPLEDQVARLKENGYCVLATALTPSAVDIRRVDLTGRKVALIFGNEHRGVSKLVSWSFTFVSLSSFVCLHLRLDLPYPSVSRSS
jgi:tRNA G18 (ribose-2'-O)-methylase SpoU